MQPLAGRSAGWDGHLVLFHENERQRLAGVAAWLRRGLDLGAKIFYIESPDEPEERSLVGSLRGTGISGDEAVQRGQLQVFSAGDGRVYDQAWQASLLDEALADGFPAVRWSAEADTAWSVMPRALHADIEWATDDLCRTRPVSVLCQYPAELQETTMETVCAMHTDGLRGSLVRTSPIPGGMAIAGEVDRTNAGIVHSALAAQSATTGETAFVVELSGLDFVDLAGARALVTGTAACRAAGGSVCLRAAQPPVDRLLRLLGVDRFDGFRVEGA